jgi:hypothetical protein
MAFAAVLPKPEPSVVEKTAWSEPTESGPIAVANPLAFEWPESKPT